MLLMPFCCCCFEQGEQFKCWQVELVPDTPVRAYLFSLGGVHALNTPVHSKDFSGGDVGEPANVLC